MSDVQLFTRDEFLNQLFDEGEFMGANFNAEFLLRYLDRKCIVWNTRRIVPVILMAHEGHLKIIQYMVENNVDVTVEDNAAICVAAQKGHFDIVKCLHEISRDNAAICVAAQKGHFKIVKYLHEHEVDVTVRNNTAICMAAQNGHFKIVKYLHEHGADVTAQNNMAIHLVSQALGKSWVIEHVHIQDDYLDIIKYFHEHGADLEAYDNEAICMATYNGRLDIVKYLHTHGCSVIARNNQAIELAVHKDYYEIVNFDTRRDQCLSDRRN